MDELKCCPFCGSEKVAIVHQSFGTAGVVKCCNTDCMVLVIVPWINAETGREIAKAWNRRAGGKDV